MGRVWDRQGSSFSEGGESPPPTLRGWGGGVGSAASWKLLRLFPGPGIPLPSIDIVLIMQFYTDSIGGMGVASSFPPTQYLFRRPEPGPSALGVVEKDPVWDPFQRLNSVASCFFFERGGYIHITPLAPGLRRMRLGIVYALAAVAANPEHHAALARVHVGDALVPGLLSPSPPPGTQSLCLGTAAVKRTSRAHWNTGIGGRATKQPFLHFQSVFSSNQWHARTLIQ